MTGIATREAPGMNTLTEAQRDRVLTLLREGKTLRRIERETGHRRETVAAYGREAGLLPFKRAARAPIVGTRDATLMLAA